MDPGLRRDDVPGCGRNLRSPCSRDNPDFLQPGHLTYNCRMVQLTLLLPFALPAPEFAPELIRSLQAPALATLLSRTSSHQHHPYRHDARALPHETWLARALGLE